MASDAPNRKRSQPSDEVDGGEDTKRRRIVLSPSPEEEEEESDDDELSWINHPLIVLMRKQHATGWPDFPKLHLGPDDWPGNTRNGLSPDCVIAPKPCEHIELELS
ncbi:hypothetical protein AX14_006369 [Amanita brunnescens Koide BX004]|nr:hypothetical protein AX14_006369 [Amanita brunnescens Koide BX004]